jgi:threonine synthase
VLGHPVEKPETIATAIRIGKPARGEQALEAAQESNGRIIAVSDQEILSAQRILASEGVWVEPASAAGLAGLITESAKGFDVKGEIVVVVCTGHGMKDPSIVTESFKSPKIIPADYDALLNMIGTA